MGRCGYEIAMSVDPNSDDDVCSFCAHADFSNTAPPCKKGHASYFRSLSNLGPIWVSDCGDGVPSAESMKRNMDKIMKLQND